MVLYCKRCGGKLRENASYCHYCGMKVADTNIVCCAQEKKEWGKMADGLAKASLGLAKGFSGLIIGGLVLVSGLTALALLLIAFYLLYHFSCGTAIATPWLVLGGMAIETVQGIPLALGGIMSLGIAILFIVVVCVLARCIYGILK